jgi:trimeric autotransporter adhesin
MARLCLVISVCALAAVSACGDVVAIHLFPVPLCEPLALGDSIYIIASADRSNFPVQAYSSITRPGAFSWSSSSPEVISVSRAGVARTKAVGSATVTATAEGLSGSVDIHVARIGQTAAISPPSATLKVGDTLMLSAQAWDSSGAPIKLKIGETLLSTDGDARVAAVYDQSPSGGMLVGLETGTSHVSWRVGQRCGALPVAVR